MSVEQLSKQEIYQTIHDLPAESLGELSSFVEFLRFKYKSEKARRIVKLEGLWKDLDFDIKDEDVRKLRKEVTNQLLKKARNL